MANRSISYLPLMYVAYTITNCSQNYFAFSPVFVIYGNNYAIEKSTCNNER